MESTVYESIGRQKEKDLIVTIFDGKKQEQKFRLSSFRKQKITFGRDKSNDIVLDSKIISAFHGYFLFSEDGCSIVDNNSTNGLFLYQQRIRKCELLDNDLIKIDEVDHPMGSAVVMLFHASEEYSEWVSFPISGKKKVTIGRGESCDIVLPNFSVSRLHALLEQQEDGAYIIRDMGSANGIYVNGELVSKSLALKENDFISIASAKFLFHSDYLRYIDSRMGISVEAENISKTVTVQGRDRTILNHINLFIRPCELVSIVGGSGAGKTTFLNCISGYLPPTQGKVYIDKQDLYKNYNSVKSIIGYVPQQDIVYDNLTLQDMLLYAAQLRMQEDITKEEREAQVREAIQMVELEGRETTLIKKLSGGQKKRASIAVELLSNPKLFFLDEPSSGLDPGTERNLMLMLKRMSQKGKTIILITHNTLNLHLCDKIIFLGRGGELCYYGTPQEACKFFGVNNFVDIYNLISEEPQKWSGRFREGKTDQPAIHSESDKILRKHKDTPSILHQTKILSGRYLRLLLNDRQRLMILLLQAPLLAFLIYLVSNGKQFSEYEITKSLLFALSCCAFWIGILNSIQEICKERAILKREYQTGLSLIAYLNSKFLILGMLAALQSGLLAGVFGLFVGCVKEGLNGNPFLELWLTTYLTALSGIAMGLMVSCLFYNPDRAMTAAPILLMPQILFSGLAFELTGAVESISIFVQCRWSMEAFGTASNLNALTLRIQEQIPDFIHKAEDMYCYNGEHLLKAWGVLLVYTLCCFFLCRIILNNVRK